ncbi:AAA family ATPase [Caldalkalibacillus mannanilyticus]|uniref:AAA family ATPase n=1 Tax=Caldalkalibacillus mannanilyticus TaxID=1418 RepID=UPI00046A2ABF|nr:P-loop NTPase [Caldalkalibacillus mannanilyticus]
MTRQQTNPEENKKHHRGEMIVVCSAKGGVGKTVLSVNLAVALSKKNIQVSVLDGDYQFGDVTLAMDLHSTFTIKDIVEGLDTLDEYSMASYLSRHESGVKVLSAPDRPEYADLVTPAVTEKVINLLLKQNDYVVVDTGVGFHDNSLQFVEKADQILIVTNLEMATLKNTKLMLETLEVLGLKNKVQVVINRSTMESVIQAADVPEILDEETPIFIPNDFQLVSQSLNIGIPFVLKHGKTEVAKAIFKMAEQISSRREISFIKTKEPSLLQKLFTKTTRVKERSE